MSKARSHSAPAADHLALERFLPYRLSVLTNRISNALARDYAERFALSVAEWRVMAVLGRFGADTATGVCRHTAMDKVTVSRANARLLKRELLLRKTDPEDRRRTIFSLSTAGQDIHDQIVPIALAFEADLLAGLSSDEIASLDHLLAKLTDQQTPD
jgi:DNA-binding MarR family transcriptional regulator